MLMTPAQTARHLALAAFECRNMLDVPMEALMEIAKHEAQSMIGHLQPNWPPLAQATEDEKVALGYNAGEPLLREAVLRDSIKADARLSPGGCVGVVGSDDKVALYQEMGSYNARTGGSNPARPFLAPALIKSEVSAERIFGEFLVKILRA